MDPFAGTVVVVTGGGSGIGRAVCRHLGRRGARVVVVDRDLDRALETQEGITRAGGRARGVRVDVADEQEVRSLVDGVVDEYGRIDYLFNNAGISVNGEFQDITTERWHRIVDVNLWGVVHGCRAAYPHMMRQRSGHLVNTASLAGLIPGGLTTPYSASKHAVVGFSLSLRGEARQYGIRVSALCPGYIQTNIQATTPNVSAYLDSATNQRRAATTSSLTAEDCVEQMIRGVVRDRAIIFSPNRQRPLWWLSRIAPGLPPRIWPRVIASTKRRAQL